MKYVMIWLIKLYQKIPGVWHNYCRHTPSCSEYGIIAYQEHGFLKGSYFTIRRILHCNPWGTSGFDPVPTKEKEK